MPSEESLFHRLYDGTLGLLASPFWLAVGVTMLIETGITGDPIDPWLRYLAVVLVVYVVANWLYESPTESIEDDVEDIHDMMENK